MACMQEEGAPIRELTAIAAMKVGVLLDNLNEKYLYKQLSGLVEKHLYFNSTRVLDQWAEIKSATPRQVRAAIVNSSDFIDPDATSRMDASLTNERRRSEWQASTEARCLGLAVIVLALIVLLLGFALVCSQGACTSFMGILTLYWLWGALGGAVMLSTDMFITGFIAPLRENLPGSPDKALDGRGDGGSGRCASAGRVVIGDWS